MHIKKFFTLLLVIILLSNHSGLAPVFAAGEPVAEQAHAPGLFDFDLSILLSQSINFFVLLFILKKYLFMPLGEVIDERRRQLAEIKSKTDAEHKEAKALKETYEGRLANIEGELYAIKQQALANANQQSEEIIKEARKKADEIVSQGEMEIFMERQSAWVRIRGEVVQLTLLATEKLIEKSLDHETHHQLIESTIDRLEKNLPDHKS